MVRCTDICEHNYTYHTRCDVTTFLPQLHVTSFTQENAAACTVWTESFKNRDVSRGTQTDFVKNMSVYHCVTLFPLFAIC